MVPIDRPKNSTQHMSATTKKYKYGNFFNMSRCDISVKQNLKKIHFTDFTRACGPRRPAGCQVSEMKFYGNVTPALFCHGLAEKISQTHGNPEIYKNINKDKQE